MTGRDDTQTSGRLYPQEETGRDWFREVWDRLTQTERDWFREKAQWEHRSLRGVMQDWPSAVPLRLRDLVPPPSRSGGSA